MERAAWTDERLDDLAESIRTGFARNDAEHREMRKEIREGLASVGREIGSLRAEVGSVRGELPREMGSVRGELGGEIGAVRVEMRAEFGSVREEIGSVRGEIDALRQTMIRIGGGMMIGFVTTLGAIIVRGG